MLVSRLHRKDLGGVDRRDSWSQGSIKRWLGNNRLIWVNFQTIGEVRENPPKMDGLNYGKFPMTKMNDLLGEKPLFFSNNLRVKTQITQIPKDLQGL